MAIKNPNYHGIHFPPQGLAKYPIIGILGMKMYHLATQITLPLT
jgi:hypothetical protein